MMSCDWFARALCVSLTHSVKRVGMGGTGGYLLEFLVLLGVDCVVMKNEVCSI